MRPTDFWNLSPREMYLAIKGFKTVHTSGQEKEQPMNRKRARKNNGVIP